MAACRVIAHELRGAEPHSCTAPSAPHIGIGDETDADAALIWRVSSLLQALIRFDLVATRAELRSLGVTPHELTAATRSGELVRVRRGWYAHPWADDAVIRAVRVGGRLACVSALRAHGVWAVDDERLHVHVPESASRLRSQHDKSVALADRLADGVVLHRSHYPHAAGGTRLRCSVVEALAQYLREHCDAWGVAALDSALHKRAISEQQLSELHRVLPRRCRRLMAQADARSESGTESIVRVGLVRAGIRPRLQVWVLKDVRVDLLIGDRLIIEVDSREFHDDPEAFERDRRRDLLLKALGFEVLRLSYAQVMGDWPTILTAIQTLMQRGQHLRLS